jgi:hypothetical protein
MITCTAMYPIAMQRTVAAVRAETHFRVVIAGPSAALATATAAQRRAM